MWIGNLALAGIPPFAGYYSKDAIISAAYAAGTGIGMYGFICTVLAAFLTAFYSWRLLFMTFHGRSRADHHVLEHVHESPPVMIVPLLVLATGAVIAGKLLDTLVHRRGLAGILERQHLQCARPTTCSRALEACAGLGSRWRRSSSALLGIAAGLCDVYRRSRCCRCGSPPSSAASTCSC